MMGNDGEKINNIAQREDDYNNVYIRNMPNVDIILLSYLHYTIYSYKLFCELC